MDFAKRTWDQISVQLAELSATQKWLVLSLMVILVLTGYLMLQYAASPELVPITGFVGDQEKVSALLKQRDIDVHAEDGELKVPKDQMNNALAVLKQGNLLAANTTAAFDELIKSRSPWLSNEQHRQNILIAKQTVLGLIIAKMKDVQSADVMVSMPAKEGFGKSHVRPTASVNVVMRGGVYVSRTQVEAIAGLVSGAFSPMLSQAVVVIDANRGRQHTAKDENDVPPGDTLEHLKLVEAHRKQKIENVLDHIPNVIVAVNVLTDSILRKNVEQYEYQSDDQLASEKTKDMSRTKTANRGEPGIRSNVGNDIAGGGGDVVNETTAESETRFDPKKLTAKTRFIEIGHATKQINASINVPRSFFVTVFDAEQPKDQEEKQDPDDAFIQTQLDAIKSMVEPLVEQEGHPGIVRVHMIPDAAMLAAMMAPVPEGGLNAMFGSGWARHIGLTLLAMISLGLMFAMVRKASQRQDLPSVQELAGLPPSLGDDDEMIGDVEESDTAIVGVELNEAEVRSRKVAEQITELIKGNPSEAGVLINRWLHRGD